MIDARATARLLGMRDLHWPTAWPLPTGAQYVMLRALIRARPNTFVAAVEPATRQYRVVVLARSRPYSIGGAREYVMLPDGRLRLVQPGEPYQEETVNAVA